jgi:hypothetical protein
MPDEERQPATTDDRRATVVIGLAPGRRRE